jgi:hypothetical protein
LRRQIQVWNGLVHYVRLFFLKRPQTHQREPQGRFLLIQASLVTWNLPARQSRGQKGL